MMDRNRLMSDLKLYLFLLMLHDRQVKELIRRVKRLSRELGVRVDLDRYRIIGDDGERRHKEPHGENL